MLTNLLLDPLFTPKAVDELPSNIAATRPVVYVVSGAPSYVMVDSSLHTVPSFTPLVGATAAVIAEVFD